MVFFALDAVPDGDIQAEFSSLQFSPDQASNGVFILGNIEIIQVTLPGTIIGGKLIPIETTSLLLASAQSFSWMIPVILSVIGIGLFVVSRKSENS